MISLDDLRLANRLRQTEWDVANKITVEYSAIEFVGEVGELLNAIKKMIREKLELRGSRSNIGEVEDEMADVLITLDLLAMRMGVDLTEALRCKFNATSYKLGLRTKL